MLGRVQVYNATLRRTQQVTQNGGVAGDKRRFQKYRRVIDCARATQAHAARSRASGRATSAAVDTRAKPSARALAAGSAKLKSQRAGVGLNEASGKKRCRDAVQHATTVVDVKRRRLERRRVTFAEAREIRPSRNKQQAARRAATVHST